MEMFSLIINGLKHNTISLLLVLNSTIKQSIILKALLDNHTKHNFAFTSATRNHCKLVEHLKMFLLFFVTVVKHTTLPKAEYLFIVFPTMK